VRISALLFSAAFCLAAPVLRAQDPGAAQDAEAAREKLLKAQDELANIQANSEGTRTAVDGVKTDVASLQQNVTALQNENATLKQQLADLQAAFDEYKADQAKERQQLISNVADMIAANGGKSAKKKKTDAETTEPAPAPDAHGQHGSSHFAYARAESCSAKGPRHTRRPAARAKKAARLLLYRGQGRHGGEHRLGVP
jgi:regulator of replication initiation timing